MSEAVGTVVTIDEVVPLETYEVPSDLYVPPDALVVFLETFEGPLDLLLYLIKRKNLDVLDIPVAEVTDQYMTYIDLMKTLQLELVGDYLVMAATLAELKSRVLLPRQSQFDEEEEDPRAELARRLLEYEAYKKVAEQIDELPRVDRDVAVVNMLRPSTIIPDDPPKVELKELLVAFTEVVERMRLRQPHAIETEVLSIRERMTQLLDALQESSDHLSFFELFDDVDRVEGAIVTLLAILELLRDGLISVVQHEAYASIYVARTADDA